MVTEPGHPTFQQLLEAEQVPVPECLRTDTQPRIPAAPLHTERWTSQRYADAEAEALWPRVWQMACRASRLSNAGDYFVYDISRYSILLVRTELGVLKGYHNSCLHRGRALKTGKGTTREIRCPYHGFCWHLDGGFKEAYCPEEFGAEQLGQLSLPEVQVATWGGWVFVNMDLDAPGFESYAGLLSSHFARWRPEERYVALHVEKHIRCNWKVALEAFIESYHSIQTHPQILSFTGGDNSQYDVFGPHLSRTITPQGVANPGQADRYSRRQTVDDMLGPGSFEQACALTGSSADSLSSRQAIAALRREALALGLPAEVLDQATESELMDSILYLLFPNFAPWGGFQTQITYRYRPMGTDPHSCTMDVFFLEPVPPGAALPDDATKITLDWDASFADVPGFGGLADIFDQDARNLPLVQQGLMASKTQQVITAGYQECRIRHFHQTLDAYLNEALSR